jgi:carboxyl-terminal processing protease
MSLSLSGIGATLTSEDGYIKIVELVPGGPAELSGKVKVNDRITSVTQENGATVDVIDMPVDEAVQYIRGKENSKVTLSVLPGAKGRSAVPVRITLTRAKIQLTDSEAKGEIIERNGKKTGYITLPGFYMDFEGAIKGDPDFKRCSEDVRKILVKFRKAGVSSLVMDLRRNGGGSLPDAIIMAGLFMKGGPVVQVRTKQNSNVYGDENKDILYSGPLVVLTSKMSASAAEIFSAALRDSGRAVMVGDSRTFGKSTVLSVENLSPYNHLFNKIDAGTLIFESAMFYRITGSSVQQLGVQPDILLPSLTEEMEIGEMYFDNHLPWDSTKAAKYTLFDKKIMDKVAVLKSNSEKRIKNSSEYAKLFKQIDLYRKIRNRKTVSLNEAQRRREYTAEKQIIEETEKLTSQNSTKNAPGNSAAFDPVLTEAVNIAADLSQL